MLLAGTGAGRLFVDDAMATVAKQTPAPGKVDQSVLFQMVSQPIKLSDEGANTRGREQMETFNDSGFMIRARAETGEDIQLWTFLYQQRSSEVIINGDLCQTCLIVSDFPADEQSTMHDTPFLNKGQSVEDYYKPGDLKITETPSKVTWSLGGREIIATKDLWEIKGTHNGVRTDLRARPLGPGFFHVGTFEKLGKQGAAGYQAHMAIEGEIEAKGKVYKITGYAVHERIYIAFPTIPPRLEKNRGGGSNWLHCFGPEFSFYILNASVGGHATAMVQAGGKQYLAGGDANIRTTPTEYWIDPKSAQRVPCKWDIWIKTSDGSEMKATAVANGRSYYYWLRRGGLLTVHQFKGDSEATFTMADGKVLRSKQFFHNEFMRTYYEQVTGD